MPLSELVGPLNNRVDGIFVLLEEELRGATDVPHNVEVGVVLRVAARVAGNGLADSAVRERGVRGL